MHMVKHRGVIAPHGICALWEANDKDYWSYRTLAEPNLIIAERPQSATSHASHNTIYTR
jgi:hypothetical protein